MLLLARGAALSARGAARVATLASQHVPFACLAPRIATLPRPSGPDGTLNPAVPRTLCRKLLEELAAYEGRGLQLLAAAEYEFCLATAEWEPAFTGPEIFVTLQQAKVDGFCYALEEQLAAVGVDVRTINPEYGSGQVRRAQPSFATAGSVQLTHHARVLSSRSPWLPNLASPRRIARQRSSLRLRSSRSAVGWSPPS